jgi:hypothetical protein
MTSDHISATTTYVMRREEHLCQCSPKSSPIPFQSCLNFFHCITDIIDESLNSFCVQGMCLRYVYNYSVGLYLSSKRFSCFGSQFYFHLQVTKVETSSTRGDQTRVWFCPPIDHLKTDVQTTSETSWF